MAPHKVIVPNEPVALKLTPTERKAVLDCLLVMDEEIQDRVRQTPAKQPVCFTLDDLEDFHGHLAAEANHTDDARHEKTLDRVLRKIERLLETYTDDPQAAKQTLTPTEAIVPMISEAPMINEAEQIPAEFREVYLDLVALTDEFCSDLLNVEYQEVCREMVIAMCQPGSPVVRGKRAGWACGIVYSVGWVNFLSDSATEPYVPSDAIAQWFGVSTATMHSKARAIREGLDLIPLDPEFSLPSLLDNNPLVWMIEVEGLLLDIRHAPREVQQVAYQQGLIPYVPADRDKAPDVNAAYSVVHQRVRRADEQDKSASQATNAAYQIKVTLDNTEPPIWRRLLVPDCTLKELHEIIQAAMGWEDCHMHEFQAGEQRFGAAATEEFGVDEDGQAREESEALLSDLVKEGHKELQYWYDFGDDWWHTIKIEKKLAASADRSQPVCLEGARACPPEDIGGPWGYAEFLEAMANPQHERHEEFRRWYDGPFDAERFVLDEVNEQFAPDYEPDFGED